MKANFPLAIHGLSPEEIRYIAEIEKLPMRTVIERLVAAGLDSIPGGGAEILDDEVRRYISPLKCSTETWLEVMRQGHALGLRTTATMVFGFGETPEQLFGHLEHLRALQDETAGFTAFICWPFQAEGTRLKLKDDTTAMRYLRVFALSRLYLDNFPNLQVSWPTMGPEVGQVALRFGGNDFGSAMIEENVVSQAGAVFKLSRRRHRTLRPRRRLRPPPPQHALRAAARDRWRWASRGRWSAGRRAPGGRVRPCVPPPEALTLTLSPLRGARANSARTPAHRDVRVGLGPASLTERIVRPRPAPAGRG